MPDSRGKKTRQVQFIARQCILDLTGIVIHQWTDFQMAAVFTQASDHRVAASDHRVTGWLNW